MTNKYKVTVKGDKWGNRVYTVTAETEEDAKTKVYGLELEKRIPAEKIKILFAKRVDN